MLADGRSISVPLAWYPRLLRATPQQRARFEILGEGQGIHWPEIDEDLSVDGLYGGECERPVRLRLRYAPQFELVYEDAAPPFDPTAWQEASPAPLAGEQVGRKGIALVLGLAESVRYERLREGNRLTLRFLTLASGAPSGPAAPPGRAHRA